MTRINGSGFRPGYRLLYDYTIPCRGGVVTRHGRGSIAGSGRAQEALGSALTLWIKGMRLSGVPEKLAVAVCSTVGPLGLLGSH